MNEYYQRMSPSLKKVYSHTPWVVTFWTDSMDSIRYEEITEWLTAKYGEPRDVLGRREGTWMMGTATVRGHTNISFSTEEALKEFQEEWK